MCSLFLGPLHLSFVVMRWRYTTTVCCCTFPFNSTSRNIISALEGTFIPLKPANATNPKISPLSIIDCSNPTTAFDNNNWRGTQSMLSCCYSWELCWESNNSYHKLYKKKWNTYLAPKKNLNHFDKFQKLSLNPTVRQIAKCKSSFRWFYYCGWRRAANHLKLLSSLRLA